MQRSCACLGSTVNTCAKLYHWQMLGPAWECLRMRQTGCMWASETPPTCARAGRGLCLALSATCTPSSWMISPMASAASTLVRLFFEARPCTSKSTRRGVLYSFMTCFSSSRCSWRIRSCTRRRLVGSHRLTVTETG